MWKHGTATTARILVVEDDGDTARGIEVCLAAMGHEVHHQGDGSQVVADAAELMPDLIILDLGLPNLGGLEVLRRLRVSAHRARIVVLSAWDECVFESAALESGADLYLEKPISREDLARAVDNLLG